MQVFDVREAEEHSCGLQTGDRRAMAAGRLSFQSVAPKRQSWRMRSWCSSMQEVKQNHPKLDREVQVLRRSLPRTALQQEYGHKPKINLHLTPRSSAWLDTEQQSTGYAFCLREN